tara:strand:+ start:3422 stop:3838 length:417 start_codon:yes stop_codon:yes gene_type:complete
MRLNSKDDSDPLKNFTEEEIADLVKDDENIEIEEMRLLEQNIADEEQKVKESLYQKTPYRRLKRSPIEIINRLLFFIFIGSFLFSFIVLYTINTWWFILYIISSFSCIFYTPNRKALKELIAAWPNIQDLINNRSLWK